MSSETNFLEYYGAPITPETYGNYYNDERNFQFVRSHFPFQKQNDRIWGVPQPLRRYQADGYLLGRFTTTQPTHGIWSELMNMQQYDKRKAVTSLEVKLRRAREWDMFPVKYTLNRNFTKPYGFDPVAVTPEGVWLATPSL
jgi:hypothetical protein